MDGDDVRVAQPRRDLRLAQESLLDLLELGRLGEGVQPDALDRHVAARGRCRARGTPRRRRRRRGARPSGSGRPGAGSRGSPLPEPEPACRRERSARAGLRHPGPSGHRTQGSPAPSTTARAVAAWTGAAPRLCDRARGPRPERLSTGRGTARLGPGRERWPEGAGGGPGRSLRADRPGAGVRRAAAEAGPGRARPLAGVRRRDRLADPGRRLAGFRARRVRVGGGLPHRGARRSASAGRPGAVPWPRAAAAGGRRTLRVVGERGAGGRPAATVRPRHGARRALPRRRELERGRGPRRHRGGAPAGLGEARPPPPPRDAGAAAGCPRRDVRAPRGAAPPGRHKHLRPPLLRLSREVREADAGDSHRRRPRGRRLVDPRGGRATCGRCACASGTEASSRSKGPPSDVSPAACAATPTTSRAWAGSR